MKISIIKFLSKKGKILEMRKDCFERRNLPDDIIEEYEVEIPDKCVNTKDNTKTYYPSLGLKTNYLRDIQNNLKSI